MDGYDYIKPWKTYLWDGYRDTDEICSALRYIEICGREKWFEVTSPNSFGGFD